MSQKGTSSFIILRACAVLLFPLSVWFLINVVSHLGGNYLEARAFVAQPLNGLLLGAFIIIGAWHMRIGAAEIIFDYVHSWARDVLLFVNWLVSLLLIGGAGWAIYMISFAG